MKKNMKNIIFRDFEVFAAVAKVTREFWIFWGNFGHLKGSPEKQIKVS